MATRLTLSCALLVLTALGPFSCAGPAKTAAKAKTVASQQRAKAKVPDQNREALCENWCTEYGSCDEEVNGGHFSQASACQDVCQGKSAKAFAQTQKCFELADDCEGVLSCL